MAIARVETYNGSPAILVDGKPYPPMAMTTMSRDHRYLKSLGDAGIKVYFVICDTQWLKPDGIELFKKDAEALLAAVPDAYMILRIGMHPPMSWFEKNMDQVFTYNDGSHQPAKLRSESYNADLPGAYSLCSEVWRKDGEQALIEHFKTMETLPYHDRIIGYFLAAGGTSEWYYINPLSDLAKGRYGDFSAAFRKEFGEILKEKYGDEETLRKQWGIPDATFENPVIPGLEERTFSRLDDIIYEYMFGHEQGRGSLNPQGDYNLGVFLNANKYPHVADFYRAWHQGTARTIIHFAKVVKENTRDTLVGAFYGSYGCCNFFEGGTAGATIPVLDCGYVDFLAAPGVYNNRGPGGYIAQREMQDSFRLRNMMFIVEEDTRTHLEPEFARDAMRTYSAKDSLNVMKRDFGRNICEDLYAWWFDQFRGGGRYDHPEIFTLIKRQQAIAHAAMEMDRRKNTQIALIYDQESIHYVSQLTSAEMLDYYRTSDLNRIGAPVDYYFHNDLDNPAMPDYRMYVFLNAFYLNDAEREAIEKKAKKNGQVVVWLYAQGFINPDRTPRMSNEYVAELTDIKVGRMDKTCSPRFRTCSDHPALSLSNPDQLYGYIDRLVTSSVWVGPSAAPSMNNPGFYIDDPDAVALGRYCVDEKVALALKEKKDYTSILCTSKELRSDMLQSIARYAGVHLYTHTDDCVYANRDFVTIHAISTGRRRLYFPAPCSPWEVYEQRYYGRNISELDVDMGEGQTLMFSLNTTC